MEAALSEGHRGVGEDTEKGDKDGGGFVGDGILGQIEGGRANHLLRQGS